MADLVNITRYPDRNEWAALLQRPSADEVTALHAVVRPVLEDVRRGGDAALRRYGLQFDGVDIAGFAVTEEEMDAAAGKVPAALQEAIRTAKANIATFHAAQRFCGQKIETTAGVTCWQQAMPIDRVGLYVPGGTAPLFSTVLMLAVPAVIAGCRQITLCTPPQKDGSIHPAILFAAREAGMQGQIFKAGGAQAIAAMAYGTESIPKADKIFGPGNRYVTAAKQLVSLGDVAIDMPAGPSEVAIIADAAANPAFIAADFLSQAEHGGDSQSLLLTTDDTLPLRVMQALSSQMDKLPRKDIVRHALQNSRIIVLPSDTDILDFINAYAPEHLIIQTANYQRLAGGIRNAGSVFLGAFTPESAGDYASGTNHTLPTNGHARACGGLCLDSFTRKLTFQEITPDGLQRLGSTICTMAEGENLQAHSNAVTVRLSSK